MSSIRTRFAPSPTGFLHLGSARTALFNWAFARKHGGAFILRIEDSDRQRSTAESEAAILEGLQWLGLDWDEPPLRQSERGAHYQEALERLLTTGKAYRCVCTREELEDRKQTAIAAGDKWTYDGRCRDAGHGPDCGPHTVRLRLAESAASERLQWEDAVFGPMGQAAEELGDMIIRRTDGGALYNFAVVVDDIEMRISHVIRGVDHQVNTAFQIAIYRALGAKHPAFAHLPLIVNDKGKKLSKRRDPVAVQRYRDEGYLADAMRNWLVRIGWSHGDDEIFSRQQIADLFTLDAVGRSAGRADIDKLQWLNQHYLKELPREALERELAPHLEQVVGAPVAPTEALAALCDLLRERSRTLREMAQQAHWLAVGDDQIRFDPKAVRKHLKPSAAPILESLGEALATLAEWDEAAIERAFAAVRQAHGDIGMGKLAQPVRVALTGSSASPGIFETLRVAGRERTLARIAAARAEIETRPGGEA